MTRRDASAFLITWQHGDPWRIVCDRAGEWMGLSVTQAPSRRHSTLKLGRDLKRDYFQRWGLGLRN